MTSYRTGYPTIAAILLIAATSLVAAPIAAAEDKDDNPPPPIFQEVIDCKLLTDPTERLSCYDTKVSALETAQASKQVLIADRAQIKEAKRGLFGFSLPKIKLFSSGNDQEDEEKFVELTTTVKSVSRNNRGFYVITLEEGDAVWEQTEKTRYSVRVKAGDEIRIKRAALSSFKANVNGGLALRVRRIK